MTEGQSAPKEEPTGSGGKQEGGFSATNEYSSPDNTLESEQRRVANRVTVSAWSLFFIWVGFSLLVEFETSTTLLGIGVILLLAQAARKVLGLKLEKVWAIVGVLFVVGPLWDVLDAELPLVPVLLILAGLALLLSNFRKRQTD